MPGIGAEPIAAQQALVWFARRPIQREYGQVSARYMTSLVRAARKVYGNYWATVLERLPDDHRALLTRLLPADSEQPVVSGVSDAGVPRLPAEVLITLFQTVDRVVAAEQLAPLGNKWGATILEQELASNPVAAPISKFMRLIPAPQLKMVKLLTGLCAARNESIDSAVTDWQLVDSHTYRYAVYSAPYLVGRTTSGSQCYAIRGFFEQATHWWVGKQWQVAELTCGSRNGTGLCVFEITDGKTG